MGLSLKIEGKEIYPLVEVAKIEGIETTEMMTTVIKEGIEKEVIKMYSIGKISLWKAAEILGISSWEMIDRLKEKNISIQVGRTKGGGSE
ncbi:MAG: UPF0175 family protein [Methanophagales archaeon]|nr:UPF0175 family protein [Methanophagales archaeon]